MESGRVRLDGPSEGVLNNPEIAALYLGGYGRGWRASRPVV